MQELRYIFGEDLAGLGSEPAAGPSATRCLTTDACLL
jgi:hypothetical protein